MAVRCIWSLTYQTITRGPVDFRDGGWLASGLGRGLWTGSIFPQCRGGGSMHHWSVRGVETQWPCLQVATNASKAPPQRGPVTPRPGPHARSDDRTGDAEMRGTSTVPPVLLAVVPWLTDAEYAIWVSDARFVDQVRPP